MRSHSVIVPSVVALLFSLPLVGQEVVSAYAGTVHFFEGVVLLDDHPLEHKAATFPAINEGSTLRTEKGRAEVLLTPNVFLRLDENSAIRMVSHALTDTQIEFLRGSAILDSVEASGGNPPIVLVYQKHRARFPKPGIYRIDSDTGVLQAYSGQAQVASPEGKTSSVDTSKLYFFDLGTITNKFGEPNEDEFYDWARGRADAIAAENQLASQESGDAADADLGAGVFNTPLPSFGTSPIYPSLVPYQFGTEYFNPFFGLNAGGFGVYNVYPMYVLLPRRPGTSHWPHPGITAGSGYVASRPGIISSPIRIPVYTPRPIYTPSGAGRVYHPAAPAPHPVAPIAIHH